MTPTHTPAHRRPLAKAALAAIAVLLAAAGCTGNSGFEPRTQARDDLYEPGQERPERQAVAQVEPQAEFVADEPETHPAQDALGDLDLPFIRASRVAGVNAFGEFAGTTPRQNVAVAEEGRAGFRQHTYLDEGFDADVAVDPSGDWLAFASTRHAKRSDIYLQRAGGLAVTRLTSDPADDAFPTFSPDGRRIAFSSNRNGSWDVFVMDADGKNVVTVTSGASQDLHPSFSPDGTRLAYCSSGRDGQWEIWVADLNGGGRTMVGFGLFPDWSPRRDRDVIAFQKARQRGGRWFSLWTMDLDEGGEPTNVSEIAVSPNAALVAPSWSPDGRRLAFATVVEPDANGSHPQQDIWAVDADGSRRQRLTDSRASYATPAWSGDGRIYFVSDRGGSEGIWSTRVEGVNYSQAAIDLGDAGH